MAKPRCSYKNGEAFLDKYFCIWFELLADRLKHSFCFNRSCFGITVCRVGLNQSWAEMVYSDNGTAK